MQLQAAPRAPLSDTDLRLALARADIAARDGAVGGVLALVLVSFVYPAIASAGRDDATPAWLVATLVSILASLGACGWWLRTRSTRARGSAGERMQDERRRLRDWIFLHRTTALATGLAWAAIVFVVARTTEFDVLVAALVLVAAGIVAFVSQRSDRATFVLAALPIALAQAYDLATFGGTAIPLAAAWLVVAYLLARVQRLAVHDEIASLVERLSAARDVRESQATIDALPLAVLVVRGTQVESCNRAMLALLGYQDATDLVGKSIRMLIPDEASWHEVRETAALAQKNVLRSRILRRRRRDGSIIELKADIGAISGKTADRDARFVSIYEDVSERLAADRAHRESARLQQLVFESAGEGIVIVNRGIVEQANPTLGDLMGKAVAELEGRPLADLFDDPDGWRVIEQRFSRYGGAIKVERLLKRSDGRTTPVHVSGRAVDWHDGSDDASVDQRSIWIIADLTAQQRREAENWHHANHDMLTGLPNRRFLQDRLEQALALARRDGRRVAVLSIDLDGFKWINDSHGHRFGDAVLEEVGRRLPGSVRDLDTVGRWGGDEFVVVLKEIESREVVEDMVRRVITCIEQPIVHRGRELSVGASVGIALYPDHGEEVETVILAADLAMYESKAAGGRTWRFAAPVAFAARGKYRPSLDTQVE